MGRGLIPARVGLIGLATIDSVITTKESQDSNGMVGSHDDAGFDGVVVDRDSIIGAVTWLEGLEPQAHPIAVPLRRHWRRTQRIVRCDWDISHDPLPRAHQDWAWRSNAIWVTEDGRKVFDPVGRVLLDRDRMDDGTHTHPEAVIPSPQDARQRQAEVAVELRNRMLDPPEGLIPIPGIEEVRVRPAKEVAQRILALFVVATRAESVLSGQPLDVQRMRARCPLGFEAVSPNERAFMQASQAPADSFVWRYESLMCLQWALDMQFELPWPDEHADLTAVTRLMVDLPDQSIVDQARLRTVPELLAAAERHQQLYFVIAMAQAEGRDPPAGLDAGVICERLIALSWLLDLPMTQSLTSEASWDLAIEWVDNGMT